MTRPRGIALLEALVAFALLSLALFGAMHWQARAHVEAGLAHDRHLAVQLARDTLERLRSFATADAEPGLAGFDTIGASTRDVDTAATRFTVRTSFLPAPEAPMKLGAVDVRWSDREGLARRLVVPSAIDSALPVHAALVALPTPPGPVALPHGRHPAIPADARAVGGQHVWSPAPQARAGQPAFLIDGTTGDVVAACATPPPPDGEPTGCEPFQGRWLTGHVRFSDTTPPDPRSAGEPPRPVEVALVLDPPSEPATCTVASPPASAASAASGSPAGAERFARYICVVPLPAHGAGWSGRLDLVPVGWRIGLHRDHRRVCRYVADLDASGAIDRNDEHPATYTNVTTSLVQQNFLMVRGDQACPTDSRGLQGPHNVDLADTVQHQP